MFDQTAEKREDVLEGEQDFFARSGVKKNGIVLPPLMSEMGVDAVINENADVWILHDRLFPVEDHVAWIEFDADLDTLTIVRRSGAVQDLGMKVIPRFRKAYMRARVADVICMIDGKVEDFIRVPLLVRSVFRDMPKPLNGKG